MVKKMTDEDYKNIIIYYVVGGIALFILGNVFPMFGLLGIITALFSKQIFNLLDYLASKNKYYLACIMMFYPAIAIVWAFIYMLITVGK